MNSKTKPPFLYVEEGRLRKRFAPMLYTKYTLPFILMSILSYLIGNGQWLK